MRHFNLRSLHPRYFQKIIIQSGTISRHSITLPLLVGAPRLLCLYICMYRVFRHVRIKVQLRVIQSLYHVQGVSQLFMDQGKEHSPST